MVQLIKAYVVSKTEYIHTTITQRRLPPQSKVSKFLRIMKEKSGFKINQSHSGVDDKGKRRASGRDDIEVNIEVKRSVERRSFPHIIEGIGLRCSTPSVAGGFFAGLGHEWDFDVSSANINNAINDLCKQLEKRASPNVVAEHILRLRHAEANQATIINLLNHEMNEMRLRIADFENSANRQSSLEVIKAPTAENREVGQYDRSFALRSIEAVIKDHPEIAELVVIKRAVIENESQLTGSMTKLEAETHAKVFEILKQKALLEKNDKDKQALIACCYDALDKHEKDNDNLHRDIRDLRSQIYRAHDQLDKTNRDNDLVQREQNRSIMRLEREKNGLVEKNNILEQTLATERLKVINAESIKNVAQRFSEDTKQSYDFYRDFYEKQIEFYREHCNSVALASSGLVVSKSKSEWVKREWKCLSYVTDKYCRPAMSIPQARAMAAKDSAIVERGPVQRASEALRAQYMEAVENSSLLDSSSPSKTALSGAEFLAMVDDSHRHDEPHTPSISNKTSIAESQLEQSSDYDSSSSEFVRAASPDTF